jgi:hypothetical protein
MEKNMDKFACSFVLTKREGELNYEDELLISNIVELSNRIDFDADLFESFEQEKADEIKALPDGDYDIFGYGSVSCETSTDWETGWVEAEWIFEFEFVSIQKNTWLEELRKEELQKADIEEVKPVIVEKETDEDTW